MSSKKLIVLFMLLILLIVGGIWLRDQLQIDICLDNGGRWNYEYGECETH